MNYIPNTLRHHRERLGLLQSDVAKHLGFASTDRISRWENGLAVPHIANLFRLAKIYGVTPMDLYPELWNDIESSSPKWCLCDVAGSGKCRTKEKQLN